MAKSKQPRKYAIPKWFTENIDPDLADSDLFRFSVKFPNGNTIEFDLLRDIDIDYDMLEKVLEELPAQYMFWAAVYSEMKSKVATLELKLRARRNAIASSLVEVYRKDGIKLTDKQMNSIIDSDTDLVKIEASIIIAQKQTGKMYHMVESIRIKSENCRSLAGFKRQEFQQSNHN